MDKKNETPFEKRSCYDCDHIVGYVSWWCGSEEATKARGTKIPGCIHCPYWKPDWEYIADKYKTKENGYKAPSLKQRLLALLG
jgi:hypothetical protein